MLYLYQSNRLERLVDLLDAVVNVPLSDPFEAETVVVPSKGMGRWISLRLAERNGICANMDFPLPASFLWQLLRSALGDLPRRSAFDPDVLSWRITALLADQTRLQGAQRLAAYLARGDDARRFELACRIADVFDQYLVYRPDWIAGWEAGQRFDLGPDEAWQQPLWRALGAERSEPHRAGLMARLFDRLKEADARLVLPERIILFGLSSAPPVFLEVVEALSERTDVCLFALNPCQEPWGDIRDSSEIARAAGDLDAGDLLLEVGNPLLASLGKQGREFFDAVLGEFPHIHPLFDGGDGADSLLAILQQDVLHLADPEKRPKKTLGPGDRSLQIHVCHSPLREVEVLHDQLLALFDDDRDIEPGDVAVLAPDISAYAPLIEAVFAPHEDTPSIPFSIADRGLAHEQPLLETFIGLLDLPQARFEAEDVLSLLDHEPIRQRFGLADADLDAIHRWVRASGIRWARDAEQKRALGLQPIDRHTWREGLRRVMLGYALPVAVAGDDQPLFAGLLPYDDIEGGRAEIFGRFAVFVETLFEFADRLAPKYTLPEWADILNALADRVIQSGEGAEHLWSSLRTTFDLLRELGDRADFKDRIDGGVIKRWLSRQWRDDPGTGGFLTGGVTFCNLVPMRSLPFKVICLIGMNDGDFPRGQRPPGFDLMSRNPRRGDRSRRLDDRYLFLETLLSARRVLYISYVGRSIRDNAALPPSVLVADLMDVVKHSCEITGGDVIDAIVTHHPLQPFDPAYYRGDRRHPGYSRLWLDAARLAGQGAAEQGCLIQGPLPEPEPEWHVVDLDTLIRFYGNPARFLLRQRLGVDLEREDATFENREPFRLDYFTREAVRRQVVETLLKGRDAASAFDLAHAAGLLPHGGFGRALYAREQAGAESLAECIRKALPESVLAPAEVRFEHAGVRLTGWLAALSAEGLVHYRFSPLKPRDRLHAWLCHLALCVARPDGAALESRLIGTDGTVVFAAVSGAEDLLAALLAHYRQGLERPLPFFVKSAEAFARSLDAGGDADKALAAARKTWEAPVFRNGNFFGESENPYYEALYRGVDPLDSEFCALATEIFLPLMGAMRKQ